MKGSVKWFNVVKGFGFLMSPDYPKDVFFHFSNVIGYGKGKEPKEGEAVEFDVVEGAKGPAAEKVILTK